MIGRRRGRIGVVVGLVIAALSRPAAAPPEPDPDPETAALIHQTFVEAYNLDYPDAYAHARTIAADHPNDAAAHRALAAMTWLEILFARGTVTTDHYMRGLTETQPGVPPPPPALDEEFQRELTRATELAAARMAREPQDIDALLEAGSCYALQATYVASVKGSATAAFRPAKKAYDAAEAVLAKDPTRASAAFVVGTYRYAVSTLALPTRLFAYLAGFGGGKEKGIQILETAAAGGDGHVEAGVSLLLIYAREGRHFDALRIAKRLEAEFPRNRIFTLESGSAAVRAGLGPEADAILTRGLAALIADPRPRFASEYALWLYKRGMARTEAGRMADASLDLRAALAEFPTAWIAGRSHLELGRIADLQNRRPDALVEYRQAKSLCHAQRDEACENDAGQLLLRPFRVKRDAEPGKSMERFVPARR